MPQNDKIQLFENKRIRTAWDEEKEEWYFSIVDVVAVLTNQPDQRGASNYWAKLKQRLKEEGADQLLTNCQQLSLSKNYPNAPVSGIIKETGVSLWRTGEKMHGMSQSS